MASEPEPRPTLVLNPPDDAEFGLLAQRLIGGGWVEPRTLQERLRSRYPRTIVRPRELAGEQTQIWYVYRDGHWVRPGR
ncbi:MAG TPA: hypothetical protein VFK35_09560 [Candidatus Limnocylindrales bacterium]|nr:hypothetical protein [Candidatus Limnocylindrales bacterium]